MTRYGPPQFRVERLRVTEAALPVSVLLEAELHPPLHALRAATRAHHDRIDRLMDLRRLGEPARYACVLQVFDTFLPAWEAAVAEVLPRHRHGWLRARSRRPFLERDLQALGIARRTGPVRLGAFRSEADAWGSLYVIEGSALGGQVITRALATQGLHPAAGGSYFHGWGDSAGAMWREFRELLEEELHGPAALAQACESACQTFDALSGLLEQALHERAPAA